MRKSLERLAYYPHMATDQPVQAKEPLYSKLSRQATSLLKELTMANMDETQPLIMVAVDALITFMADRTGTKTHKKTSTFKGSPNCCIMARLAMF